MYPNTNSEKGVAMLMRNSVDRSEQLNPGRVGTLTGSRSRSVMAVAVVFSVLIGLIISGCGSNAYENNPEPTTSMLEGIEVVETPLQSVADDVDAQNSTSSSEPRRGGVFRTPSGNLLIPDPALFSPSSAIEPLLGEIYSGLMQLTDDPNDALRTDLAERYTVRDGVKYEFVLKRDLKFSDGSPVTASDFKWSWERALKPSTGSQHAAEVFGFIAGASEVLSGETEELKGVDAVDDRTLLVTLSEPSAIFPYLMADPVAAVLKRENVQNWGINFADLFRLRSASEPLATEFEELPVGTGPFKVVLFDFERAQLVLARNDHYHEGPTYLDGVEFVTDLFEERNGQMVANFDRPFEEGSIDWTFGGTSSAKNELGGEIVARLSGNRSDFLIFNSGLPPYDDVFFRRALIGSVELESHHGDEGGHEIPGSLIPPLLTGHDPDLAGIGYDPVEAVENLGKSEYADESSAIRPTFHTDIDGHFQDEFEFITHAWRNELGTGEGKYQYAFSDRYEELLANGKLEMVFKDVNARYPDGLAVLSELLQAFGPGNSSDEHAELDSMIQFAKAEADAVARLDTYDEIQRFVLEQALVMPFEWPSTAGSGISLQPWVNGYREPAFYGSRFKDVWFDDTAPKRELPAE